jgi:phosphatidylserine/phosphatidylglycerophosphate/cardiolipin synthase-like enzyme
MGCCPGSDEVPQVAGYTDEFSRPRRSSARRLVIVTCAVISILVAARGAAASDQMYFPAVDNVTNVLVNLINNETTRVDIATWLLSEHSISIAIANRWRAGVPVRLIGDRGSMFESDPHTKTEFYWLASQGVPIRLRYNPSWYPEINHWKAAILVGQNKVLFGSGNFAPTELAPVSSTNYDDESELVTDDPALVGAFKTKFDVMWNDTTFEPQSIYGAPPYLKNWDAACALESGCADYRTLYPNPVPMSINTARLEPNRTMPPDMIWGQGPDLNNRMIQEINNETTRVDVIEYRLTVPNITQALITKFRSGVPVRVIIDTFQYANKLWPEYELTHAYVDQLYAAGLPIRQRVHAGVTHMKTIVTSTYALHGSSNYAAAWQRDHDYFVSASAKPAIYAALKNRFATMWNDNVGFTAFSPQRPDAPGLASPGSGTTAASTTPTLVWNRASYATSYDVYLGTSASSMALVGNVAAKLVNDPPPTYSWTASSALAGGTTYFWKIVSRTFATPVNAAMVASSSTWSFTTSGSSGGGGGGGGGGSTAPNVVIYANDIPAGAIHGIWSKAADSTAAAGVKLVTSNTGWSTPNAPLAAPANYVDVTFSASAGVPYTFWLRMQALGNDKYNDSAWVQFSDATVGYRLNTTSALLVNLAADSTGAGISGWGWQHGAYWLSQATTVTFSGSGTHTLRVQVREDGVQFDQIVLSANTYLNSAPGPVANDRTIVPKPGSTPPPPAPAPNVVIYAADVAASAMHGSWSRVGDGSAAAGVKLATTNTGWSSTTAPQAGPANYVDVTFNATANVPYTIWMRLQALNNDKYNDSLWVQFSDAFVGGSQPYSINSTSGLLVNLATDGTGASINRWGWVNSAYWLSQPTTVTFRTTGAHTMRIQVREDGVQFDQIVLSPSQYLNAAPGLRSADSTIVPK